MWDIGILVQLFHCHEVTLKDDFGGDLRQVFHRLHSIKDMRNRRVHEISRALPISARDTYNLAETAQKFFELLTVACPDEFHRDMRSLRLTALQMLFVEEIHVDSGASA